MAAAGRGGAELPPFRSGPFWPADGAGTEDWNPVELQQYLMIMRERWGSALLAALVVLAAVVGYTLMRPPAYEATNRVFVQTDAGGSATDLSSGVNFASQQIISYADLATTPLVLEPVIEELKLEFTAEELAERISTEIPEDTLIIDITAWSGDAAQAAVIANATSESLREQVSELESVDGAVQGATEGDLEATAEGTTVELTVISPATAPDSPTSPSIPRDIIIGGVLALLAAIGTAIIRDFLDNRIRSPEDIETAFDRPVIGAIPADRDAERASMITVQRPQSVQAEAYRELRTNLQFMQLAGGMKSFLVTSSLMGEGKTSSAINLAHVLAQAGERVLLIDADLRRPSVAEYLGLEHTAGLTTVLIEEAQLEDVTQPLETEGLDVLTSGPVPPNPSELLGSQRMKELLDAARCDYDYVVLDSAPLLAVTDAAVLSRIVGGTVVVAQSDRVKRQQLGEALEKLDAVEAHLLGVVLNRMLSDSRSAYAYAPDPDTSPQHSAHGTVDGSSRVDTGDPDAVAGAGTSSTTLQIRASGNTASAHSLPPAAGHPPQAPRRPAAPDPARRESFETDEGGRRQDADRQARRPASDSEQNSGSTPPFAPHRASGDSPQASVHRSRSSHEGR